MRATWRRTALTVGLLILTGGPAGAGDWPQWRGADGSGVVAEGPLPERWGPDGAGLRWRTPIPGEGISSPIAHGDRVFLTTAYEGAGAGRRAAHAAILGIALGLLGAVVALRRRGAASHPGRVVVAASLLLAALAAVLVVAPDLLLEAGNPGRGWRVGGGLGLLGLAVAVGWLGESRAARWTGAGLLVLAAALVALYMPSSQLGPVKWSKRFWTVFPGLAFAALYAVRALRFRPAGRRTGLLPGVAALALAVLVFVTPNYLNALQRVVVCLDLDSGEILWQSPVFSAPPEQKWPRSTYATPTPATDGRRVFAHFGAGLASVDLDGRVLWVRRFSDYTRHTRYGAGTSPVLSGDRVLLVQEKEMYQNAPASWMAAFEADSGRTRWRVELPDAQDSYNTPLLMGGERRRLVMPTWHQLAVHDLDSGERLWSLPTSQEQVVASLGRSGDLIAATGGVVGDKALLVLRIDAADPGAGAELLWESRRGIATIASPVIYEGRVYTVTDGGIMTCYDAESGATLWKARLQGEYYGSLLAGDGKVYATNTEGRTSVVAAGSEHRLLAVNELDGAVYSSPAVAGDCLLLRTARELVCVDRRSVAG